MKTLKITKKDVKDTDNYWKDYIGEDVSNYDGHIEIEGGLGQVRFEGMLVASGHIIAEAGSGIEAGWGIKAGREIKAGWGIKAGREIEAGWGIKAGAEIEAGWGIEAGSGIEAGLGIVSLYSWIKAKLKIKIDSRCAIIAGCFSFDGKKDVEAQEIEGNVAYGNIKLLPKEETEKTSDEDIIEVKGIKYAKIK